jgi:H+/gluconate symporter-like permease
MRTLSGETLRLSAIEIILFINFKGETSMIELLQQIGQVIKFVFLDVPMILITGSLGAIGEVLDAVGIIKTLFILVSAAITTLAFFIKGKR